MWPLNLSCAHHRSPPRASCSYPLTCTHLVSPVYPLPAVFHTVSKSPLTPNPSPTADSLIADWSVPGDLRPVSMPPEYNWMVEAKEPSTGKRGSRGTHTQTHVRAKSQPPPPPVHVARMGRTGATLCSILSSTHFSSSSGYPWWCGCVRIHISQVCI